MNKHASVYVHIPFCVSKCAYCDFVSYAGMSERQNDYAEALIRQIKNAPNFRKKIDTVYIGGGTPSVFDVKLLKKVIGALKEKFDFSENCEASLEANPDSLSEEKLSFYKALGINRISIGLQSLDDGLLSLIGRAHDSKQALKAVETVKNSGFENFNTDIMFSLPKQNLTSLKKTLDTVTALKVPHISVYSLILEEGTPLYLKYKNGAYKENEKLDRDMYALAHKTLTDAGYIQYEISNFALPGYECRHNVYCWELEEYYGFGCAAHGFVNNIRYANTPVFEDYIKYAGSGKEYIFREEQTSAANEADYIMLGMRMTRGISLSDYAENFGCVFTERCAGAIAKMEEEELAELSGGYYRLTLKGLDFANRVIFTLLNNK